MLVNDFKNHIICFKRKHLMKQRQNQKRMGSRGFWNQNYELLMSQIQYVPGLQPRFPNHKAPESGLQTGWCWGFRGSFIGLSPIVSSVSPSSLWPTHTCSDDLPIGQNSSHPYIYNHKSINGFRAGKTQRSLDSSLEEKEPKPKGKLYDKKYVN